MPYMIVSCACLAETGPTVCGDSDAPAELMEACEAEMGRKIGDSHDQFISKMPPRSVFKERNSPNNKRHCCGGDPAFGFPPVDHTLSLVFGIWTRY
jgi:hypothetical protein